MSDDIATATVSNAVELSHHNTCTVANGLLEANSCGALEVPDTVVDDPGDVETYNAVYICCGNEYRDVQNGGRRNCNAKLHSVADSSDQCQGHHEERSPSDIVRGKRDRDTDDRGPNVDWHSQKLGSNARIAGTSDDERKEARKVKTAGVGHDLTGAVQPDLWIVESQLDFGTLHAICWDRIALVETSIVIA